MLAMVDLLNLFRVVMKTYGTGYNLHPLMIMAPPCIPEPNGGTRKLLQVGSIVEDRPITVVISLHSEASHEWIVTNRTRVGASAFSLPQNLDVALRSRSVGEMLGAVPGKAASLDTRRRTEDWAADTGQCCSRWHERNAQSASTLR